MSKPTESEASILFRICGQKDAEIERLRAALAAAEAKMETIEATATANARDYWQAKLADERKQHAITTFILEDERKHADALADQLTECLNLAEWPAANHTTLQAHAARRAAEVGNA